MPKLDNLSPGGFCCGLMIVTKGPSEILRLCFKSSFSSGASVPVLPLPATVPVLSSEIVKLSPFKGTKRRLRKFNGNGGGGGYSPSGNPSNESGSSALIEPLRNFKGAQQYQ